MGIEFCKCTVALNNITMYIIAFCVDIAFRLILLIQLMFYSIALLLGPEILKQISYVSDYLLIDNHCFLL